MTQRPTKTPLRSVNPRMERAIKRFCDVGIGLILLVITAPLIVVVAGIIRLRLGSPVLFCQERTGRDRRTFVVVKFRTMKQLVAPDGMPLPDGLRMTPFGALLRKTSIDELPQLWNVLKGDISLVGPRPLPLKYLPFFKTEELSRFSVSPGITGWAQVHGRNELHWDKRFTMDVWYVENWSLWLDVKILLMTVANVFFARGVSPDANLVMRDLDDERRDMRCSAPRDPKCF